MQTSLCMIQTVSEAALYDDLTYSSNLKKSWLLFLLRSKLELRCSKLEAANLAVLKDKKKKFLFKEYSENFSLARVLDQKRPYFEKIKKQPHITIT